MHILFNKTLHITLLFAFLWLWGCGGSNESSEEKNDAGSGLDAGNADSDAGSDAGDVDDAGKTQDDAGSGYDPCWSVMDAALPEGVSLNGVWGSGLENVFAAGGIREGNDPDAGKKGVVMHYDGTSWSRMEMPDTDVILSINGSGSDCVCFLDTSGSFLMFNEHQWFQSETNLYWFFGEVLVFDKKNIFIAGSSSSSSGAIYYYNGEAWESIIQDDGYRKSPLGIWGSASDDVYVAGSFFPALGSMLHYDGSEWAEISIPYETKSTHDVWGTSSTNIYVATSAGYGNKAILHFDGLSWHISKENIHSIAPLNIEGSRSDDIYTHGYVIKGNGSEAEIQESLVYHFDGNEWSEMNIPETWIIMDIWAASEGEAFAVGYDSEDEKARIFRYSCGR